jgi:hypothetical protein
LRPRVLESIFSARSCTGQMSPSAPVLKSCGSAVLRASERAQPLPGTRDLWPAFFFSRDVAERNTANHVFATIAYQLAFEMPSYGERLCVALEQISVPLQATRQFIDLLIVPLGASIPPIRPLIVILDALDGSRFGQPCHLAVALRQFFRHQPSPKPTLFRE